MNRLFITCPFSHLETTLRQKYGNDILVLSAIGGVLPYREYDFIMSIKDVIEKEKINNICFVNDISCRFINNILTKQKLCGFPVERGLEELYIDNYFREFKGKSLWHQQKRLAELNVSLQIKELLESTILGKTINNHNIIVNGLVTSQKEVTVYEINQTKQLERIYEF